MNRLADEARTITLGGAPVELVPSLRAALVLARQFGTYGALIARLMQGDTRAIAATINAGTGGTDALSRVLAEIDRKGILAVLTAWQGSLVAFVVALTPPAPADDQAEGEAEKAPAKAAERITFDAYHESLFSIATGVLGWTPAQAWASTPSEILAAHKGRVDFVGSILKAVFGTGESSGEAKPPHEALSLDEQALAVFGRGRRKKR